MYFKTGYLKKKYLSTFLNLRFNALERIFRVSSDTLLGWPLEVKKIEMAHVKQKEACRRRCRQKMEEGKKRLREINILKCETQETICYGCSYAQLVKTAYAMTQPRPMIS